MDASPLPGKMMIVSGPSGVGKDTVIDAWAAANPRVRRVVAATTRPPREGERDAIDYTFLTRSQFDEMASNGLFLEHKEVHGHGYATPKDQVEALVSQGCIAILKIDVQGAEEVRRRAPGITSVFILPPTWDELERRIRERGTESEEAVALRLANARKEVGQAHRYLHQIVNSSVESCIARLEDIAHG